MLTRQLFVSKRARSERNRRKETSPTKKVQHMRYHFKLKPLGLEVSDQKRCHLVLSYDRQFFNKSRFRNKYCLYVLQVSTKCVLATDTF